jgi:glycosyltransferase involved in cell wall biosynthesis
VTAPVESAEAGRQFAAAGSAGAAAGRRPLVSVVMIFLNPGPYLDEAVRSVLGQTVADLELLLVDDGSSDGSEAAARAWAARDPRVVLLTHPGRANRGTGASRTLGVERARGRWVTFLDGDDVWLPHHLERQLAAAGRHPDAAIVVSPTTIWVSWRGEDRADVRDHVRELPYSADTLLPAGALLESATFAGAPIPTCGLMFRRSLVPSDGLCDPDFRGLFEDQTIVARLTVQAPAVMAADSTSRYRQHLTSVVHRSPGRGSRDPATLRYLEWIEAFLAAHGELSPERRAVLTERRAVFEPRWRFWTWYWTRWLGLLLVPHRVRAWLRRGRAGASGVLDDQHGAPRPA